MNFFAKLALELVNVICANMLFYNVAKRLKLFHAIFVMYPANQQFADHYTFRWRQRFIKWKPFIAGVIVHPSGKRTLAFAISSHLDETHRQNIPYDMRTFHSRVEKIANQLGGVTTHFAGTIPSRLAELRVNRGKKNRMNERAATVDNVVRAIRYVRTLLSHKPHDPIIVLGSKGYIGREVMNQLASSSCVVVGIDLEEGVADKVTSSVFSEFPKHPHIVVNITVPEAVNQYIDRFNSHTTLLNEVFPQPDKDILGEMIAAGAKVFHLSGVLAKAFPLFPFEYHGAVPCCAALQEDYDVKVIRL